MAWTAGVCEGSFGAHQILCNCSMMEHPLAHLVMKSQLQSLLMISLSAADHQSPATLLGTPAARHWPCLWVSQDAECEPKCHHRQLAFELVRQHWQTTSRKTWSRLPVFLGPHQSGGFWLQCGVWPSGPHNFSWWAGAMARVLARRALKTRIFRINIYFLSLGCEALLLLAFRVSRCWEFAC